MGMGDRGVGVVEMGTRMGSGGRGCGGGGRGDGTPCAPRSRPRVCGVGRSRRAVGCGAALRAGCGVASPREGVLHGGSMAVGGGGGGGGLSATALPPRGSTGGGGGVRRPIPGAALRCPFGPAGNRSDEPQSSAPCGDGREGQRGGGGSGGTPPGGAEAAGRRESPPRAERGAEGGGTPISPNRRAGMGGAELRTERPSGALGRGSERVRVRGGGLGGWGAGGDGEPPGVTAALRAPFGSGGVKRGAAARSPAGLAEPSGEQSSAKRP